MTDAIRVLARAEWPGESGEELPRIAGFVASSFSPLVAETAERCLSRVYGTPPAAGPRTAVLLASASGDLGTARAIEEAVAQRRRVPPLLFFQSNPNAVLGHIAARWQLTGPVVALGPGADGEAAALAEAALLLADGDAEQVLVIAAEQGDGPGEHDSAVALLVARS